MNIYVYVYKIVSDIEKCDKEIKSRGRGQREERVVILEQLKKDSLRMRHLS